jgi:hypothetical protein
VEVGKLADLIVVDGNPLEDIHYLRRLLLVLKKAVLYRINDELAQAVACRYNSAVPCMRYVGRKPPSAGAIYRGITVLLNLPYC